MQGRSPVTLTPEPREMKTRFVLIETSHAGNVGATARAMKVMGFEDLVLVAPRHANVLRLKETIERASGAISVLRQARIVPTLDEALDGMTHLCATAMIGRDFGPPTRTPREHFEHLRSSDWLHSQSGGASVQGGVAFLFGTERFGMRNDDVYRCHVALQIPSSPQFGSLNLAAAVQVIAYEWRLFLQSVGQGDYDAAVPEPTPGALLPVHAPADAQALAGLLSHWQTALVDIGFLDTASPKKLMPTLNQLFNRAQLSQRDVHILRGIARAMMQPVRPGAGVNLNDDRS